MYTAEHTVSGQKFLDNPAFRGEVRVQNKLSSNERLYNVYLAYKVSCLQIKYNPRNKATNLHKFACRAAAIIYIEAKPQLHSGLTL